MSMKNKKICFICSGGGHFEEIKQLSLVRNRYEYYFVFPKNQSTLSYSGKKYFVMDFYRKNRISFIFRFLITSIEQLFVFIKEKPDIVITTGAGVVIPTCMYAHLFKKKLIYIESIARINSLAKTGKLLYKYADLFIVQWEELLKDYPNAIYGGWIF